MAGSLSWFTNSIVSATSPTTWTATVIPNGSVPFGNGKAEIDGSYSANDQVYVVFVNGSISQQVKLNQS